MQTTVQKTGSNKVKLSVELTKNELQRYLDNAELDLGKNLDIDGFRKGKIPKDLVRKNIPASEILKLAMESAIRDSLAKSIEEQKLDVLNVSNLNVEENKPDRLAYSVLLVLFPDIKIGSFDFKVKKRKVEVDEKELDSVLEDIKASKAVLSEKKGPTENGDRLEIDFEVRNEGQILEGGISKNHPLVLGKKVFIPGFEENLVGMIMGEEKTFALTAPLDYSQKALAGKRLDFHVKVKDVKKISFPELDDNFVRSLGEFKDKTELVKSVKEGLIQEKTEKEKQRVRLEILDNIIKKANIDTPGHMVDQQVDNMITDFDADLHKNGMELGPYLAHLAKTQDDLKKEWREEAEKQVKIFLALHKIARDSNISADIQEVENTLNETLQALMTRGELNKEDVEVEKLRSSITTKIINEKTMQFLEKQCVI